MPIQYCVLFSAIYDIYDATNIICVLACSMGVIIEWHQYIVIAKTVSFYYKIYPIS